MRTIILSVLLLSAATPKAQIVMPAGFGVYGYGNAVFNSQFYGEQPADKKWSFSKYSGISTSMTFFKGGSAYILSAPIGLQLNRKLNNNLYAFANVTVAPAYINFTRSFINGGFNKTGNGTSNYGQNSMQVYSAASMGLMYINDEKTFSISGSIGVGRSGNPFALSHPASVPSPALYDHANK